MSVKDPRLSQILPVIRCSDCGHDVEFRMLGEHVCSSAPPMPALPAIPVSRPSPPAPPRTPSRNDNYPPSSGMSSGAYKPGYKPPPIPISSPSPATPGSTAANNNNNYNNNYNSNNSNGPVSPGRPSTASPRPALPFLEKYAKKKSVSSASSSPPAPNGNSQNNNSNNNLSGSPLSVSPTTPTAPSYDRQVLSNGMNSHYQREQSDYFPKTQVEDRLAYMAQQQQQLPSRSRTPMDDGRYGSSSPIPSRSKTPVMDPPNQYGTSPSSMRTSQPALPQKSNARSPSVASAQGLGIQGLDSNGRIKSPTNGGYPESKDYGRDPRDREREREKEWDRGSRQQSEYDSSPPSISNGFNRTGSSGSTASSVLTERTAQRERSNTVLSERSERSVRSVRSERSERSGLGERSERSERSDRDRSRYPEQEERGDRDRERDRERGRAPPARKPSGDQFDEMMDNLIQEFNVTSTRDSSRPASSHRSRSRPNIPDSASGRSRDLGGSPPPTPGLPRVGGGDSDSVRSHRSGRERGERSDRDREREQRSERSERDREGRSDRDRERSDRDRERDRRSERSDRSDRSDRGDREREGDRDRGEDRERDRARDRERTGTSGRSSTRSRSTNRRGIVQHCESCKHDIQPHEAADVVKMPGGDYHAECFKCMRCRRPLESPRNAYEYEGRLLCEKDYQRYMERDAQRSERSDRPSRSRTTVCAGCEAPIQGESPVYALGQSWHEHHLTCYQCKKPIQQSVGHVEKNGRVYCPKDFGELFLPKCRACNLPVEKEAVCAQDGKLQGKWHAACFGCQTCKKPFPDKSFYVYGDAPYCRRHYHKLNNSLCKGCDQPIEGPCAQTMEGWRFHPGCFCCVECKTALTDIYYNFENQAYCEKDMMVIQRTRNVRAERRKTFFGKV
ncbi:hypothetical protein BGX21_001796 [Mortierella sp. AD011]|nr:hypothetical protein BGX21_001796 [Mortierella sp. AD011]